MLKIVKQKRKALYVIALLIAASTILAVSANIFIRETKTYSATNYDLRYDDTKLAITNIDGLRYDTSGNLDQFNLTVQNKDTTTTYAGKVEVSVSGQSFQIQLPMVAPGDTTKIAVDVEPNLSVSSPVSISATVILEEAT